MSSTSVEDGGSGLNVFFDTLQLLERFKPTPLVRLRTLGEVWAKLEFFNPLSRSIKDRVAYGIIRRVVSRGIDHVLDASSGNYGIAIALLSRLLGIKATIVLPLRAEKSIRTILRVIGVDVVESDIEINNEDMIKLCRELAQKLGAVFLDQFENDVNPEIHYETTGKELVRQLRSINRKPQVFVAAMGTSGHIAGIGRALREEFPDVKIIGVCPRAGEHIPGMKPRNAYMKWASEIVDEVVEVTLEYAIRGVVYAARREGLLIGLSSGAVVYALAKYIIPKYGPDKTYVTVFPDDIFKYVHLLERFSDKFTESFDVVSTSDDYT